MRTKTKEKKKKPDLQTSVPMGEIMGVSLEMVSVQPVSHQLSHRSDLLHLLSHFISMGAPRVCDSGQSADQSMFCSACTEILSNKIMIRKVEMVCDLLTAFNISKTCTTKLKNLASLNLDSVSPIKKKKNRENIFPPR